MNKKEQITLFEIIENIEKSKKINKKEQIENRKKRQITTNLRKQKEKIKRKEARKQIHKKIEIKENKDKTMENEKKKNKKMIPIFLNLIHKESVNILEKVDKLYIYGKSAYIVYYLLRNKIKKYNNLKNLKIEKIDINKYKQNLIRINKKETNFIKANLEKLNINYLHVVSFLNFMIEDKKEYENNKYNEIYRKAKKYKNIENKKDKLLEEIEKLNIEDIKKIEKYINKKTIEIFKNNK